MKKSLMEGKVVLVTGSTDGIGKETIRATIRGGGAEASIRFATSPELEGKCDLYFERSQPEASSPLSRDRALQKRFWETSERLVDLG